MIRLLRRVGSMPAGTETDEFEAAAEAAFLLDGTAEAVDRAENKTGECDYESMSKEELLRLADSKGIDVRPRAAKREIAEAIAASDDA